MQTTIVKPAPGRTVRDPETGQEITGDTPVPADNAFWIRRIADGDVIEVKAPPAKGDK